MSEMPQQKQLMTTAAQTALTAAVRPVEMWARPWMVELSRNSRPSASSLPILTVKYN
jgi:hypothetical protein